jgi:hypothetical protein
MPSYGYDGPITADAWAKMQQGLAVDYSTATTSAAKVTTNTSGAQVAAGTLGGWGVLDIFATSTQVTLTAPGSGQAWWMICARRNWTTKATTFVAITAGTARPSTLPTRQMLPGELDEQPLALVGWTSGQSQPNSVVDLRAVGMAGQQLIFDSQAMQYLTRPGRQVSLNAVDWSCVWSGGILQWIQSGAAAVPACKGTITTSRGVSAGTWERITGLGASSQSTPGMLNATSGIVTVPVAGWYSIVANVTWATRTTSARRMVQIEKGSGTPGAGTKLARVETDHIGYSSQSAAVAEYLNAGDTVSAVVFAEVATDYRGDLVPASLSVARIS